MTCFTLRFRRLLGCAFLLTIFAPVAVRSAGSAGGGAPGAISGRIINEISGAVLERARVTVEGTFLEAFSDSAGRYVLSPVPPGAATLRVFHTGLAPASRVVAIPAGGSVEADFSLTSAEAAAAGGPLRLERFVVGDSREMSGTAIAINEQRFAPNLRSVVSVDEFGDSPDGNVAEFLKFLPGVNVNSAREVSINGVPSANVPVTIGGFSVASVIGSGGDGGTGRSNSMDLFTTSNLSRIEVSFSPTPESEGAALAGSVNLVPRSAFDRVRPAFNASAFTSMLNNSRYFLRDSYRRRFFPGVDFSLVAPVSRRFGVTLSGGHSTRLTDTPLLQNVWRGVGSATNGGTFPDTPAGRPYLSSYTLQTAGRRAVRSSLAANADFRLSPRDRLTLSLQYSTFDVNIESNQLVLDTGRVLPGQFSTANTKGAAGSGTLQLNGSVSIRTNWNYLPSLVWRHDGPVWKAEAGVALARSLNHTRNSAEGAFGTTTARRTGVTVAFDDVGYSRPGAVTVTDAAGAPVDPFALSTYAVTAGNASMRRTDDTRRSAYANLRRDFTWVLPWTVKAGLDFREAVRDARGTGAAYTFLGRDGVASTTPLSGDDQAVSYPNPEFMRRNPIAGFPVLQGVSAWQLWEEAQANPGRFTVANANTQYRTAVGLSTVAAETISSAYVRLDLALLHNRLRLVGGVRAEQTNISAAGPLTDPTRNYQRDAQGNVVLGANRRPVPVTTDAYQTSLLTYLDRGSRAAKEYLDLFPSLNASFNLRENLILRAAAYTSIGRPDFIQYSGGLTLPDTESPPSPSNRISVNNAGIRPWSARTVSVRAEYYFPGLGQLSAGAFRRDFSDFFGSTVLRPGPEFLEVYNLDPAEYGDYDVATQRNLTSRVRMEGTTLNYKQALGFLPRWARGVQVFGNLSVQRTIGEASANFVGFVPRTASWGASLTRERLVLHVNWNHRGKVRQGPVAAGASIEPGTFTWLAPRQVTDVIVEYKVSRRLWLFANLRNLLHEPQETEIHGPSTPGGARLRQVGADFGSLWTIGVKGGF